MNLKAVLGASLLALAACTTPKPASLPVRHTAEADWPPGLTLEQLKRLPIQELVDQGGLALTHAGSTNVISVTTWEDYHRLTGQGYYEVDNFALRMTGWISTRRGYIPFFQQAIPANKSHLSSLKLDQSLLPLLPLSLGMQVTQDQIEAADLAAKEGRTWLDFYPGSKVTESKPTRMRIKTENFELFLRVQGYGDYNHDGYEDLLVAGYNDAIGGSLGYGFTAILTRKGPDEPLQRLPEAGQ